MSYWTHIVGVLHVETYKEVDDIEKYVRELMERAPKITGSEGPADIFVNAESGHDYWTSCDCKRCPYKDTLVITEDEWYCTPPEDYKCQSGEYQTRVIITVCGDLRDRMRNRTQWEWEQFCRYIAEDCEFDVRNSAVTIEGC